MGTRIVNVKLMVGILAIGCCCYLLQHPHSVVVVVEGITTTPSLYGNSMIRSGHYVSFGNVKFIHSIRGGAKVDDDDEESDEDDEEEEVDEDEDERVNTAVATSTLKAVSKSVNKQNKQKITELKKVVNTKLESKIKPIKATTVAPKKKTSSRKLLRLPYVMKAFLNPFTIFAMTKAYWASLFNLNYLKKEQTQELRSALEEKAKKGGNTSMNKRRGTKTMKRGQAKSLSDLPQLST